MSRVQDSACSCARISLKRMVGLSGSKVNWKKAVNSMLVFPILIGDFFLEYILFVLIYFSNI